MTTKIQLSRLLEAADKADVGPWLDDGYRIRNSVNEIILEYKHIGISDSSNGEFVAMANPEVTTALVQGLVEAREALRDISMSMRSAHDAFRAADAVTILEQRFEFNEGVNRC